MQPALKRRCVSSQNHNATFNLPMPEWYSGIGAGYVGCQFLGDRVREAEGEEAGFEMSLPKIWHIVK